MEIKKEEKVKKVKKEIPIVNADPIESELISDIASAQQEIKVKTEEVKEKQNELNVIFEQKGILNQENSIKFLASNGSMLTIAKTVKGGDTNIQKTFDSLKPEEKLKLQPELKEMEEKQKKIELLMAEVNKLNNQQAQLTKIFDNKVIESAENNNTEVFKNPIVVSNRNTFVDQPEKEELEKIARSAKKAEEKIKSKYSQPTLQ
ncbi:MAG: hypothetical protein ACRC4M_04220 [Mycoplasma sp.]